MTFSPASRLRNRAPRLANWSLAADVLRDLQQTPKRLAPMYFYDERGSQLFDRICELPEYYVTRTETAILEHHAREMAECIGEDALLVEFGSGASTKTRLLLDQLPRLAGYVPVDISRSHLMAAARRISDAYPRLEVLPVCADFTRAFAVPSPVREQSRTVVFFPGSTIGNFDTTAAVELLKVMRGVADEGGGLLIGTDLVKDPQVLESAYNDAAGVTAAFNLNALRHINRELGADFNLAHFEHDAVWNPEQGRIEMHLVSKRNQTVAISGESVGFAAGERLVTEHCHKYTLEGFSRLADAAGWAHRRTWTDGRGYFAIHYFEGVL